MVSGGEGKQVSLRQRLFNVARRDAVDFQAVLTRYALERFLWRLGCSDYRESYVLKGAFLFQAWRYEVARPTRDLDLLGHGTPEIPRIVREFAEIAGVMIADDGLDFTADPIRGEAIRESSRYDGIRIRLGARLGRTRIPLRMDIGFGDAAGLAPVSLEYPALLDHERPRVMAYSPQYVVAEKLEAMVSLGDVNTRLKDFYDVWRILTGMQIRDDELEEAIRQTFAWRRTTIPSAVPSALTPGFASDARKLALWHAFLGRNGLNAGDTQLPEVVEILRERLLPLLERAR